MRARTALPTVAERSPLDPTARGRRGARSHQRDAERCRGRQRKATHRRAHRHQNTACPVQAFHFEPNDHRRRGPNLK